MNNIKNDSLDLSEGLSFQDLIIEIENSSSITKNYAKKNIKLLKCLSYFSKRKKSMSFSISSRFLSSLNYRYSSFFQELEKKNYIVRGKSYSNYCGKKSFCKKITLSSTFGKCSIDDVLSGQSISKAVSEKIGMNDQHLPFSKEEISIMQNDLKRFTIVSKESGEVFKANKKIKQGYFEERLYSSITNVSNKDFFFFIDGEETVELDISNSFPAILSQIILDEGYNDEGSIMFSKICQNGFFYEFLAKSLNTTRKKAKNLFQVYLNSGHKIHNKMSISSFMGSEFREVHNFIYDLKKCYGVNRLNSNGEILFDIVSKQESQLVCRKLSNRLRDELSLCLCTKHDSIIFKKSRLSEVMPIYNNVMEEIFTFYSPKKVGTVIAAT
jgi:hypothetical protein